MPLISAPALFSDLKSIHRFRLSIHPDGEPIERFMFPNGASDINIAAYAAHSRKCISDPNSTMRPVIAKDSDTGKIVSCALWFFPRGGTSTREVIDAGWVGDGEWASDVNKESLETLIELKRKKREDLMKGKPHVYLASLLTSPTRRRQGAASELIKWGLSLADAHHLPTFVQATSISRSLFLKYGFKEADTLTIDLCPLGTPHTEEYSLLIRAAPPLPSPDTIAISPWLTNADLISFPAIEDAAFGEGSPLSDLMFGPTEPHLPTTSNAIIATPDSNLESTILRISDTIDILNTDPTLRILKAFNPTTSQIVATAHWNFYLSPSTDAHIFPPFRYPPSGNPSLGAHYFGSLLRAQDEHMRGQAYIFMRLLVVLPSFQNRGIGTRLLRWGLEHADQFDVKAWIDASPAGLGLYQKLGWEEVGRLVVELEEWGGKEGERDVTVSMVREPGRI